MKAIAALMLIALLAGCGSTDDIAPSIPSVGEEPYRLDSGDQIELTVFGQPDLSGEFFVRDDGTVAIPLLGAVTARNATAEDLSAEVEGLLADGLLVDPDVSVQILEYRPFFVLGEVEDPGQYAYQPRLTVLAGVAIAGGFTIRADQDDIVITRIGPDGPVRGRAGADTVIAPGDVIFVEERFF